MKKKPMFIRYRAQKNEARIQNDIEIEIRRKKQEVEMT